MTRLTEEREKEIREFVSRWRENSASMDRLIEEDLLEELDSVRAERDELKVSLEFHQEQLEAIRIDYARVSSSQCDSVRENYRLRDECGRLSKALRTLRNETKGTLHAHELAIRYDSGNSNWNCLEIALQMADEALSRTPSDLDASEGK